MITRFIMTSDMDIHTALCSLTKKEIQATVPVDTFARAQKRLQSKLEKAVHDLPDHHCASWVEAGMCKRQRKEYQKKEIIE